MKVQFISMKEGSNIIQYRVLNNVTLWLTLNEIRHQDNEENRKLVMIMKQNIITQTWVSDIRNDKLLNIYTNTGTHIHTIHK